MNIGQKNFKQQKKISRDKESMIKSISIIRYNNYVQYGLKKKIYKYRKQKIKKWRRNQQFKVNSWDFNISH